MAGGTFTVQNKVRPGAYINFKSVGKPLGTVADRGIMTMPLALKWGPSKTPYRNYCRNRRSRTIRL